MSLTINNPNKIIHDIIQNWYVNDIVMDKENNYILEVSRLSGADVIDVFIKIGRTKSPIGLYQVHTWFQGHGFTMAVTKSDIANRTTFRNLLYYNILKKVDECLQ